MNDKQNRELMAALIGECRHESDIQDYYDDLKMVPRCTKCHAYFTDQWSASIDGEMTKEVRDWLAKEMPEVWEIYLNCMNDDIDLEGYYFASILNYQLSISNFCTWLRENYKEFMFEKCKHIAGLANWNLAKRDCPVCNGTGLTPIKKYVNVIKIIEEEKA